MNIILIGAGNVATHISSALYNNGHRISYIWSRSPESASLLGQQISAIPVSHISEVPTDADFYLLSVKDDAIAEVIAQMPAVKGIVLHTAGSVSMKVLSQFEHYGVLYPLQTLSKQKHIDFAQVPLCIEASDEPTQQAILDLARSISQQVVEIDSEQRLVLHIAAVLACNFTHHLIVLASDILKQHQMDIALIQPLIAETFQKVSQTTGDLAKMQTGPAIRHDMTTIHKHLAMLQSQPMLQHIYKSLTESIQQKGSA